MTMDNEKLLEDARVFPIKAETSPTIRKRIEPIVKVMRERGGTYKEIHKFLESKGLRVNFNTLLWVGYKLRSQNISVPGVQSSLSPAQGPKSPSPAVSPNQPTRPLINDPDAIFYGPPSNRQIKLPERGSC
jgi:hypothetical protein